MSSNVTSMANGHEAARRFLRAVVEGSGSPHFSSRLTTDPVRAQAILGVIAPIAAVKGWSIDWVTVNGRRVDVGVAAPGREWRVVLSIDSMGVHSASAAERPPFFGGVLGGRAVIVNGPSSAGKSTAMDALLAAADTPWVKFDELSFGAIDLRFLIWRDQLPRLLPGFLAGIAALAAEGNQVILTAAGFPSSYFDDLRRRVPTLNVGLDCPLEVRIDRQSRRPDRWGGLTEGHDDHDEGWTYDLRFDTSTTSPEEIGSAILRRIAEAS